MSYAGGDNGCDELLFSLDWLILGSQIFLLDGMAMFWYVLGCLKMGLLGFFVYLYFLKKGQFEDLEDTKYQIFWDE